MKDFFKMFFASLLAMAVAVVGGLFAFGVVVGALISMTGGLMSSVSEPQAAVKRDSILYFDMSANIQDRPVNRDQQMLLGELMGGKGPRSYSLLSVVRAIEEAATDSRIKGLYLKGSFSSSNYASGYAALKEVREAIERFKESGKPVVAQLVYPSAKDLYVGSAADTIYMNPYGIFASSGMVSQPIFFAGFFEKYGIGVQVTKAGEYKSAAEPFVLKEMSEPAREATEALLTDLWDELRQGLAEKSGRSEAEVQALFDQEGLITAQAAAEFGIVDEVGFAEDVLLELKRITGSQEEKLEVASTALHAYIQEKAASRSGSGDYVAVVYAEGEIVHGEGDEGQIGGDRLGREIRKLRQDKEVKAIVLRVNSPGGSALASEVIQHEVREAKAAGLPVVVSMGNLAASGGYWISAYGEHIFAEPNTVTGSIGVIGLFLNVEEIANRHGFTFDVVKTAKFADAMSIARPKTEEEMAIIQSWVDMTYEDFLQRVAEGRGMEVDQVAAIAEGRVWSGEDALELGLVDELGGLQRAIAYAGERAGLTAEPPIREFPRPRDFLEELFASLAGGGPMPPDSSAALSEIAEVAEELNALARLNDPRGVYALHPYRLNIK